MVTICLLIDGGKLGFVLNQFGLITDWACDTANVCDNRFQPLIEQYNEIMVVLPSGASLRLRLRALFFSQISNRLLGTFEIILALLLALRIQTEFAATVNAALFGLFLLFKLFLIFTKQGNSCGCFGAHELITIDLSSVIASVLVLGLAVVLPVLTQRSSANWSNWIVKIIFSTVFGWLVFKLLWRRRLAIKFGGGADRGTPA